MRITESLKKNKSIFNWVQLNLLPEDWIQWTTTTAPRLLICSNYLRLGSWSAVNRQWVFVFEAIGSCLSRSECGICAQQKQARQSNSNRNLSLIHSLYQHRTECMRNICYLILTTAGPAHPLPATSGQSNAPSQKAPRFMNCPIAPHLISKHQ